MYIQRNIFQALVTKICPHNPEILAIILSMHGTDVDRSIDHLAGTHVRPYPTEQRRGEKRRRLEERGHIFVS